MSPEQATGDQFVGSATDTYALGVVLYEMLTGDPPYWGSTAQAVLGQIIAALFALTLGWSPLRPEPPGPVIRVAVVVPEEQSFRASAETFDLSRDGLTLSGRGAILRAIPRCTTRPDRRNGHGSEPKRIPEERRCRGRRRGRG